ncbi:hypothetical protein [Herbihabitans rhizosphaerae]|nr:hypothetical protein [Herbihabitans rhizosphaerae]
MLLQRHRELGDLVSPVAQAGRDRRPQESAPARSSSVMVSSST